MALNRLLSSTSSGKAESKSPTLQHSSMHMPCEFGMLVYDDQ